jgi:hypothetical protein
MDAFLCFVTRIFLLAVKIKICSSFAVEKYNMRRRPVPYAIFLLVSFVFF